MFRIDESFSRVIALQSPHAHPYVLENDASMNMYEPFTWKENPTYVNLPKTAKTCLEHQILSADIDD